MRIAVLSRKRTLHATRRLREEALKRRHRVEILDPFQCVPALAGGRPAVLVHGREIGVPDVVIPRVGTSGVAYAVSLLRQFRSMGASTLNDPAAILRAKDKFGSLQRLSARRIPVPETVMVHFPRDLPRLARRVGGPPLVMKMLRGTQGTGVILAENLTTVQATLEAMWSVGEDVMLQRFVQECEGTDVRTLVIDGKVRAAMRRVGVSGEFRANVHRGGRGERVRLPAAVERVATAAVRALGLRVAGVDLLESDRGPLVLEVNASPGFEGLEAVTGKNVAGMLIRAAAAARRRT